MFQFARLFALEIDLGELSSQFCSDDNSVLLYRNCTHSCTSELFIERELLM